MKSKFRHVGVFLFGSAALSMGQNDATSDLRNELDALRSDYEKRINQLESRIRELETEPEAPAKQSVPSDQRGATKTQARAEPKNHVEEDAPLAAAQKRETQAKMAEQAAKNTADERFREDTETRDLARRADSESMLAERIESVLEGYLDITGYFRAGYGRSDEGGAQQAFGIPGVAKYRLGNETDNYGELAFAKTFYPAGVFAGSGIDDHDPVARMVYRMSFVNPYNDAGTAAETDYAAPELWGSLTNVIPGMPDAKLWAGNRYYRRHDIHINDFYFWDMSGGGAGIEDVPLGAGKLAFAWIGDGAQSAIYSQREVTNPANSAGFSKSNFDLRYYDWNFVGGKGEVGLIYANAQSGVDEDGKQAADSDGLALDLVRTDEGFLDENSLHKLSLQVGNGPAKTFNSGFDLFSDAKGTYIRPDPNESWRFRATDQVVVKPLDHFSVGSALVYQYTEYGDDASYQQWVSGGVRPVWHITDSLSLAFEGGLDWVSDMELTGGGTLGKLTIAPQVSLGDQFLSRPVLRAFLTYAAWADGLEGKIGGADYNEQNSGWTWGVQMESWW